MEGDQLTAGDNNGTYTFTYDALGRVASEKDIWNLTQTFTYDAAGNRTLVQDSLGGVTTSVYNADNELTTREFYDGTTPMRVDETYNADGQLATITYSSNLAGTSVVATTAYTYNADGAVTDILSKNGSGTVISNITYTYDAAQRLTNENDTGTLLTYTYDNAGQLTADGTTTVTYDATGNRNSGSYTTGTGNELTSDGTYDYSYDAAGNETLKVDIATGDTWQYGYNVKGQMVSAKEWTSNPVVYTTGDTLESDSEYTYDVLGNRTQVEVTDGSGTTTTRYAYDLWNPAKAGAIGTSNSDIWATLDGSSSLTSRQLQGDGIDQHFAYITGGGTAYWYLTDHIGSIRTVLDDTGAVKDAISYDAYGNITSESDAYYRDLYAWTGRELDAETGLQYNRARYYDASAGRWISQDPMGFDAGDSNLYRYVSNAVNDYYDPSGLDFIAVGNRGISGAGKDVFKHLDLEYYESNCGVPMRETFQMADLVKQVKAQNLTLKKIGTVELLPESGWKAPSFAKLLGKPNWTYADVSISKIVFGKGDGTEFTVVFSNKALQQGDKVYTNAEIKSKWDDIVSLAEKYAYAEQASAFEDPTGKKFQNWPNSLYPPNAASQPTGNNSNTFVYFTLRQIGFDYSHLAIGWRNAGAQTPRPYLETLGKGFVQAYWSAYHPVKPQQGQPLPALPTVDPTVRAN